MKQLLLGLSFVGISPLAFSQTVFQHVKDALAQAEKNNIDYAIAMTQPDLKKVDKFLAEGAMMPQVTGFASGDYNARLPVQPVPAEIFGGAPGTYKELRFGLPYNLNAGIDVNIPIIKANQWFEQLGAKAEWERSQSEAAQATENILLRTSQAYFSYMAAQQLLALNEEYLQTSTEVLRIVTKKWEEGRIGEAEKIRAENLHRSAGISMNNAKLEMDNAKRNLETLLRTTGVSIHDKLDNYITKPSALPPVSERSSYIMNQRRIQSLQYQSKARIADFFPSLSFSGRYAYYYQANNPFKPSSGNITYDQAIVGLRLHVPLFGGARNYARLKQANTLLKIGEMQFLSEQVRLEKEHADIVSERDTYLSNYALAQQKAQSAAQAELINRKRYEEGIITFTEYSETFYDWVRARQESLQMAARLAYLNYLPNILTK